ncbi:conserved hypothetical protein [Desulfamplus magnetovallimortis]|uniref:Uncharacterized protein n=1 Tax=Desulfamplus magnetovallimortis TaxID=1246637 RepID=A0A1W1HBZ7_9BACT|nr:hypothetical protein [Desulfamplus magnetovallimortis]SLM30017.1 conserved hypothetical protein [Desulfamplus magnetovallimortis]
MIKFYQNDDFFMDDDLPDDSRDCLDCFGEFSRQNTICTKYCSDSIRCAIEHHQNPAIDILEHILEMEFFPARMN